jgi:hypothetical protein
MRESHTGDNRDPAYALANLMAVETFAKEWKSPMRYIITAYADKLNGALELACNDVHDALRKARELIETSSFRIAIRDCYGNKIGGDDLIACCNGTKRLSRDLKATESARTERGVFRHSQSGQLEPSSERTCKAKQAMAEAYRYYLRGKHGTLVGYRTLAAESDFKARSVATEILRDDFLVDWLEVWRGSDLVFQLNKREIGKL